MYIYSSHMGDNYATSYEIDHDDLYCETCGDRDYFLGEAETADEAYELVKDEGYADWCVEEFLYTYFNTKEDKQ